MRKRRTELRELGGLPSASLLGKAVRRCFMAVGRYLEPRSYGKDRDMDRQHDGKAKRK